MRILGALIVIMLSAIAFSRTEFECVQELVDAISHADVMPSGVQKIQASDLCGPYVDELACGTNQFWEAVRTYCTNICTTGNLNDRIVRARFKGSLSLLDDYVGTDSSSVFSFCTTNIQAAPLVRFSALAFGKAAGVDRTISFYNSEGVRALDAVRKTPVCEGLTTAFELIGGRSIETNKMIRFGLDCLGEPTLYWSEMDESVCRWWPEYATSSNRYLAAQRALQVVPPPASSNYLNRVIAELEALPPGTMHLLPTNHLGTAWSEE